MSHTSAHDPLLRFRDRFPILSSSTYLVSNSLGAMPSTTADRLGEYAESWKTLGVRAWADRWWQLPIEVGNIVAPLIGAPAGSVAMVPTVSQAQAMIIAALNWTRERDEIPLFCFLVCLVCLVEQDQLDELDQPDEPCSTRRAF